MTVSQNASLLHAAHFAAQKHRAQRRKDPEATPYINHPIAVADLLARVGAVQDPITLQAALLHDTIEDTDTTAEELRALFGAEVCQVVQEVTDDKSRTRAERKRLQVEHAAHLSPRAKLVKLADKIANLRDLTPAAPARWSKEQKQEYLEWAEQVVAHLRGLNPALEQLFDSTLAEKRAVLA
jgi:guanosine-3',5'-bis(diphosphate) 3'-pyrophosphohydrolase